MTRNQLELIKKGTYFFLVVGLGGSVLWLSSGGNVFQSDVVGNDGSTTISVNFNSNNPSDQVNQIVNATTSVTNPVPAGTIVELNDVSAQVTIPGNRNGNTSNGFLGAINDTSTINTNSSDIIYASAPVSTSSSTNRDSTTSFSDDFADLVSTTYTSELNDLRSAAYTGEVNTTPTPASTTPAASKSAAQMVTATPATTPQSGPEDVFLVVAALMISAGVMYYKKLLRVE